MKQIDYSLLRNGQTFIVHSGNPTFFGKAIIEFQEMKYSPEVAKFHHTGKLFFSANEWWVCEEKRLSGVGNTRLSEYLAKDASTYMIREPNFMTVKQESLFMECFMNDVNTGFYDVLGVFQLAYMFSMYKLTGQMAWMGPEENKKHYVCSARCAKWDNEVLNLYPEWYKMTPAEYVVTSFYRTVMTI